MWFAGVADREEERSGAVAPPLMELLDEEGYGSTGAGPVGAFAGEGGGVGSCHGRSPGTRSLPDRSRGEPTNLELHGAG